MFRKHSFAVVIPAYNEEKLIAQTVNTLPDFVDHIITINDGSKDKTLNILKDLAKHNKRISVIDNKTNLGLGSSMVRGFEKARELNVDLVAIVAGDAQCDPEYLSKMADKLIDDRVDYVKANRFSRSNRNELKAMPTHRRVGNIFITLLTKFTTGYYSMADSLCSYGVFTGELLNQLPLDLVGKRYDFEITLLVAMSVADAKVEEYPVPAMYGEETSTISILPTAARFMKVLSSGFWRRIYYKYVYDFHPIALLLFSGIGLTLFGLIYGLYITWRRLFEDLSPSTGTVMIIVLPLVLGFQLLLTALIMDVNNEGNS